MRHDTTIALAGRTGAGKTTVGERLAEALAVPLASFGAFVRSQADARDLDHERETLQTVGQSLIETLGWPTFCAQTLAAAGVEPPKVCVVEGVRHVEAVRTLRSLYSPVAVALVWLDAPDEQLATRLRARGEDPTLQPQWERHETERQVLDDLPAAADFRVASDDEATPRIVAWIGRRER
jgi:shikimate kinase